MYQDDQSGSWAAELRQLETDQPVLHVTGVSEVAALDGLIAMAKVIGFDIEKFGEWHRSSNAN